MTRTSELLTHRIFDHAAVAVGRGELRRDPFPHFVADDVLPDDVFGRLVADLPPVESMMRMSEVGFRSVGQYEKHATLLFSEVTQRADPEVWREVEQTLGSTPFEDLVRNAVAPDLPDLERQHPVDRAVRLDCAQVDGFLQPHTDAPAILMKALIYLAPAHTDQTGDTLLYRPRNPDERLEAFAGDGDFTDEQYAHESEHDHVRAAVVPFRPNRMFAFRRTRDSLHGLDRLSPQSAPRYIIAVHYKFRGGRPKPIASAAT